MKLNLPPLRHAYDTGEAIGAARNERKIIAKALREWAAREAYLGTDQIWHQALLAIADEIDPDTKEE